jgi:hypothetical protein
LLKLFFILLNCSTYGSTTVNHLMQVMHAYLYVRTVELEAVVARAGGSPLYTDGEVRMI